MTERNMDDIRARLSKEGGAFQTAAANENKEESSVRSRLRRKTGAESETVTQLGFDLANSEIYKTMTDSSIDMEERAKKIAEMLVLDFANADTEKQTQVVDEIRAVIGQLSADFDAHNEKSLILVRDNPLSELKKGIQEAFENYHKMDSGRENMRNKLANVDRMIEEEGGLDKVVDEMLKAQSQKKERELIEADVRAQQAKVDDLNREIRATQYQMEPWQETVTELSGKWFLGLRGRADELADAKESLKGATATVAEKSILLQDEQTLLAQKAGQLEAFDLAHKDSGVHERILEVLDIGNPEFKKELTGIANAALQYIDDTKTTLDQSGRQLEKMLKSVEETLDVNSNLCDNVVILESALRKAREENSKGLTAFKEKNAAPEGSLQDGLDIRFRRADKIKSAANKYIGNLEQAVTSTTMTYGNLEQVKATLVAVGDQIGQGLTQSNTEKSRAITTTTASAANMMKRAEGLSVLSQILLNKGLMDREAANAVVDLRKDFERSVLQKGVENDSIVNLDGLLKDIAGSMLDKNDQMLELTQDQMKFLDDLSQSIDDLRMVTEETRGLQAKIVEDQYTKAAPATAAPKGGDSLTPAA